MALSASALLGACGPEGERAPDLRVDPAWTAPAVETSDGMRFVQNPAPEVRLEVRLADAAIEATQLLFWGDQAVARDAAGFYFAANAEHHEVLMFDEELGFLGALLPQGADGDRLQRPLTITASSGERLAAFEAAGTVLLFDRWGREFERLETPFAYTVGTFRPDGRLTLARSPYNVAFSFEGEDPPLLTTLDPRDPDTALGFGTAHVARSPFYVHAANAGSVTADESGNIFYSALGRAEVEKYDAAGKPLWVSRRPAGFDTPAPQLVQNPDGPPTLLLATVQKASAIGPDGLLYIRAAAEASPGRDRLEVLDPETGVWLRSASLDTGTAVLVGRRGAVWEVARSALRVERTRERRVFANFALESFEGDSVGLEDLSGKVALVAFWASWCGPCREELPLLDSLDAAIDRPDFEVIGIAEDVNEEDARSFAEEIGLRMTALLGHGRMRQRYHYSGLPYSVLLDQDGRIIKEYYGFGGREAFDREVAGRVLAALSTEPSSEHGDHQHADATGSAEEHDGHQHHGDAQVRGGLPAVHHHDPAREVTGREIAELRVHLEAVRRLDPAAGDVLPGRHWEVLQAALAQVDNESNAFMERFAGTFPLIQLLTLKTQLYVDSERLPELEDPDSLAARWQRHLSTIEHLLEAYRELRDQLPENAT